MKAESTQLNHIFRNHIMTNKTIQSLKYVINRFILRKPFLIATENQHGTKLKFKTEDVVGRHIYKRGEYEKSLSDFIAKKIIFKEGDVALDIGANIGWYSLLLGKLIPQKSAILAFEPDPLNFELLTHNIKLNSVTNVTPVNCALSDKKEIKKLFRYSNKNLGRHSLLDINEGEFVEVEAVVLDDYLSENKIDFEKVKFIKIDIEGYEYFALCGAKRVLDNVQYLISEFVPKHMKKGGVEPGLLIDLLTEKGLKSHILKEGELVPVAKAELLSKEACDIVWVRQAA